MFFFRAVDKLATALKRAQQELTILILRMRKVLAMDATRLNALEDLQEHELGDTRRNATAVVGKDGTTFEFGMNRCENRTYTLEELKGAFSCVKSDAS